LTPHGEVVFEDGGDAPDLDARIAPRLREGFGKGSGEGLWRLGASEAGKALPPFFVWWRDFAARFVTALRRRPGKFDEPVGEAATAGIEPPPAADLAALAFAEPERARRKYIVPPNRTVADSTTRLCRNPGRCAAGRELLRWIIARAEMITDVNRHYAKRWRWSDGDAPLRD
jgi:hypothetical protein